MVYKLIFSVLLATFSGSIGAYAGAQQWVSPVVRDGTLPSGGKILAVLVAGSNGYDNYRHQADICHAYHVLRQHGIPEENIITMMYDDIATSKENTTPGIIINKPGGSDVYEGVKIDYKGEDVNSDTFLAIVEGNSSAVQNKGTGRVLKSTSQDHVFVNFVDHGAPGLLAFPHETLLATRLHDTLSGLAKNKQFKKMLLYIEACESGSMFEGLLPDNINIMAMTAADPRESSYACYYDETRQTYLGDVFSVKWMEDSDVEDLTKETIHHQFQRVRAETNKSHVEEYGDLDMGSMFLSLFMGGKKGSVSASEALPKITDAVPSRDVLIEVLHRKLQASVNASTELQDIQFKIQQIQEYRRAADSIINNLVRLVANGDKELMEDIFDKNWQLNSKNRLCYEQSVEHFQEKCFKIPYSPYLGGHLYKLVNMCSTKKTNLSNIRAAMDEACKNNVITGVA